MWAARVRNNRRLIYTNPTRPSLEKRERARVTPSAMRSRRLPANRGRVFVVAIGPLAEIGLERRGWSMNPGEAFSVALSLCRHGTRGRKSNQATPSEEGDASSVAWVACTATASPIQISRRKRFIRTFMSDRGRFSKFMIISWETKCRTACCLKLSRPESSRVVDFLRKCPYSTKCLFPRICLAALWDSIEPTLRLFFSLNHEILKPISLRNAR